MIRPDQDVVDAGRHEPTDDGERTLGRACVVFEPCTATSEDGLRERVALHLRTADLGGPSAGQVVHVEKRLMVRVVRKEQCVDGHDAWRGIEATSERQANRLAIGHHLRVAPLKRRRAPVGGDGEASADQVGDGPRVL